LVETIGSERTWTLTGSKAYTYGRSAPEPKRIVPFSRPAKCAALSDGSLLVVDTGNNRVIVVDRQGNQTWPLDEYGFDYYSSPARTDAAVPGGVAGNYNLQLSQPADAHRYVDAAGAAHTVITDTGHNRVVDVITTALPGGGQQHRVVEVTPSHVRPPWDPTRQLKLRYVRAQPIFDFNNNNVIGYLCAATNVDRVVVVEAGTRYVDPNPGTIPPGGTPAPPWRWARPPTVQRRAAAQLRFRWNLALGVGVASRVEREAAQRAAKGRYHEDATRALVSHLVAGRPARPGSAGASNLYPGRAFRDQPSRPDH